jgi:Flp pilus assembly CpaF family ATPase
MTATERNYYREKTLAGKAVGRPNPISPLAENASSTANLYCANSALDAEVRRLLGEAITAQLAGSEAQELSANPAPHLKTCKVLTDFGVGDWRNDGITISCDDVVRASRYLASASRKLIPPRQGFFSTNLTCGARYSAILPPAARAPGFTIRIHRYRRIPLTAYMTTLQIEVLTECIRRRANIIIAGAMFSGKTTFLRSALELCIEEISPDDRYAIVEDTPELRVEARNLISLLAGRDGDENLASFQDHILNILRQRADRFVIGEIRGAEAFDLIEVWNTGISGNFTTIHANSAREVLPRLEVLIERAGGNAARLRERIAAVVGLIIYVKRLQNGERRVTEMLEVGSCKDGYEFKEVGK